MAHTWKLAIGLGLLGASLAVGCVVKEGDDDDAGGAAGEGGTSGSGGKGGTGGTTGGSAGKAGSSGAAGKGGSAGSGTGGATGGTGGSTGGAGGSSGTAEAGMGGDNGGTGGTDPVATCDPPTGELDSTPYPNCDADPATDECELCIQESCCEESKTCYGTEPFNVCGWGGPTEGPYAGLSEKGCFQRCLFDKVKEADGECLGDDAEACGAECATTMCYEDTGQIALIGNATIDLVNCMQDNCAKKCFNAATCGN
jgi:hypothetical protein